MRLLAVLTGHSDSVGCLAYAQKVEVLETKMVYSPHHASVPHNMFASGSKDKSLKIWMI